MPRNTLTDLNNLLFEQMERLMDPDLDLEDEIHRAKAMSSVSNSIVANANVQLEAMKLASDSGVEVSVPGNLLESDNDK